MSTREELLRGVAKVNNERIDVKDSAVRSESEVSRDGGSGGDKPPAVSGTHAVPASATVPAGEESLPEFVKRRATEVVGYLETNAEAIADAESLLRDLEKERSGLTAELKQLEKISAGTSSM